MAEEPGNDSEQRLIDSALLQVRAARERQAAKATPVAARVGDEWPPGYRIERRLQRGGQGTVYRARRIATDQAVAIKVIDGHEEQGQAHERFDREVRVLARLKHPGIVTVQDRGSTDDQAYYVMEYVEGDDLDQYLEKNELDPSGRVELCRQISDAVSAAHRMGVIHRDLKPGNIRVDTTGSPRILDFGLARDPEERRAAATKTGAFVGSVPWASPEQVASDADDVSLATDVYALGVVFYQVFAGRFPYDTSRSLLQTFDQIANAEPIPISESVPNIDRDLEAIVHRCLQKEPAHRYASAAEVSLEFRRFQQGLPIEARGQHAWYILRKRAARYRVAALVTLAFATSLVFFVFQLMHGADQLRRTATQLDSALTARELDALVDAFARSDRSRIEEILDRNQSEDSDPLFGLYRAALHRDLGTIEMDSPILAAAMMEGREVAIGTWDGTVAIANAESGAVLRRFTGALTDVRDIAYRSLATGPLDRSGRDPYAPPGIPAGVSSGEPSTEPSGRLIAAGSDGITWLDSADGQILRSEPTDTTGLEHLSVSDAMVLAATRDGRIYRFPVSANENVDPQRPPASPILTCRHPSDGREHAGVSGVSATALSAASRKVATAGRGAVRIWNIDVPDAILTVPITRVAFGPQAAIGELRLSADGSRLAIGISNPGARNGTVVVIDTSNGSSVEIAHPHGDIVTALSFFDRDTLLVGDDDGGAWTFDLVTGAEVGHALPTEGEAFRFAVSDRSRSAARHSNSGLPSGAGIALTGGTQASVTLFHGFSRLKESDAGLAGDPLIAWSQPTPDERQRQAFAIDANGLVVSYPDCLAIASGIDGLLLAGTDGSVIIQSNDVRPEQAAPFQVAIPSLGVTPTALAWADGQVVLATDDGTILVLSATGELIRRFNSDVQRPKAITCSSAGSDAQESRIAILTEEGAVSVIALDRPAAPEHPRVRNATAIAFMGDSQRLLVGTAEGVIQIVDGESGDSILSLPTDLGPLQGVVYQRKTQVLYAMNRRGLLRRFPLVAPNYAVR